MGLARAWSVALFGVDGVVVEIEADVGAGTVKTQLLGLPDAARFAPIPSELKQP